MIKRNVYVESARQIRTTYNGGEYERDFIMVQRYVGTVAGRWPLDYLCGFLARLFFYYGVYRKALKEIDWIKTLGCIYFVNESKSVRPVLRVNAACE